VAVKSHLLCARCGPDGQGMHHHPAMLCATGAKIKQNGHRAFLNSQIVNQSLY
jgi:hypothetical protein